MSKRLDEILDQLDNWFAGTYTNFDVSPRLNKEQAKQEILEWVRQEIIGENEYWGPMEPEELNDYNDEWVRNELRDEQREKLKEDKSL